MRAEFFAPPSGAFDNQMWIPAVRQQFGLVGLDRNYEMADFEGEASQLGEHVVQTGGLNVLKYIAAHKNVSRLRRAVLSGHSRIKLADIDRSAALAKSRR